MRRNIFLFHGIVFVLLAFHGCNTKPEEQNKLFSQLDSETTGVNFVNQLDFQGKFNIYTYRNFYNGGGVGIADINNDGLPDIYFIANMEKNHLYLNKGDFNFEDITESSGTGGTRGWSTGVSMADVNGDGWIDIYVCNSGDIEGDDKRNELFINNGDLTFTERAAEFGLDDPGFSIHGAFFDYDRDGDLDFYLANNSYKAIGSFDLRKNLRTERDSLGGDRLFRNDNNRFSDISEEAGIYGSVIGFTLGVTVGDVNLDGWQDIFISTDFFERDYLYINQQDGTFKECLIEQMRSISAASMGADIGDINNDIYPDLFVTDMLPQSDARMKTVTTFESWDVYKENQENDYYHQFTRNMLQLNNGNGTFTEVGRMLGIQSTDWSWGALIFDMDNDGLKDLFVANGIFQDLTDQDYLQYFTNREVVKTIVTGKDVDYKKLIGAIPSQKLSNFAFQNQSGYNFINKAHEWGLDDPSFSNGSAYGDLDNDGDYDLVVNNVNMKAFVFRNESDKLDSANSWLKVKLIGTGGNTFAIGARVIAKANGENIAIEQMPTRGYQSTMDHTINIGLGKIPVLDSLIVIWPDGRMTLQLNVAANQAIELKNDQAGDAFSFLPKTPEPLFIADARSEKAIDYRHIENEYSDFARDKLLFHMISTEGPAMCVGDVNGDGLEDIFAGGAKDAAGSLFLQDKKGGFNKSNQKVFEVDALCEDVDARFFDADNDSDLDLYVVSGSNELPNSSTGLIDRLYFNDGKGNFTKSDQILPSFNFESTSCVRPCDFDRDGDLDLFVGGRSKPFFYGLAADGFILENDGKGKYTDVTTKVAQGLKQVGMITDAAWADIDTDGDQDLILVGEWMPITIFINEKGNLTNKTKEFGLDKSTGWWTSLAAADLDKDGDIDLVGGNHGINTVFKGTESEPVTMYVNDFDLNGSVEQVLCVYKNGISYPHILKHDLVRQLPGLSAKYMNYKRFINQTIDSIFTPSQLENASILQASQLKTSLVINQGNGRFIVEPLPPEAQVSPVYAILVDDFDGDGISDILFGGNLYNAKPETGRYDASYGTFLKGMGNMQFRAVPAREIGFNVIGEIREMTFINISGKKKIAIARNNDTIRIIDVAAKK